MTYDSFEAAKIANPNSEIVTTGSEWGGCSDLIGKFEALIYGGLGSHGVGDTSWVKCNPANHCMTVEKFLADGHRLEVDDWVIGVNGLTFQISSNEIDEWNVKSATPADSKLYILRAAALEIKESKPFMQTGEEFEHTKTLNFIYERLIEVHGENPSYDYMRKLKDAIMMVEDRESPCNKGVLKPRDSDYAMSVMGKKVRVDYERISPDVAYWSIVKEWSDIYDSNIHYSDDDSFLAVSSNQVLLDEYFGGNLYRRIETEIDDRQEFIDAALKYVKLNHLIAVKEAIGDMYDSGNFKLGNGD